MWKSLMVVFLIKNVCEIKIIILSWTQSCYRSSVQYFLYKSMLSTLIIPRSLLVCPRFVLKYTEELSALKNEDQHNSTSFFLFRYKCTNEWPICIPISLSIISCFFCHIKWLIYHKKFLINILLKRDGFYNTCIPIRKKLFY